MVRYRDPSMLRMERQTRLVFKLALAIIGLAFLICIGWHILFGFVASTLIEKVHDNGLKSVIEDVWEGPHDRQDG